MSGFDDHPNVVVLEDVVQRLVLLQCHSAPDPKAAVEEWQAFLQGRRQLFTDAAFRDPKASADDSLNAMAIAGQFDEFSKDLRQAFDDSTL